MSKTADAKELLRGLPAVNISADGLDFYELKALKGKFVVTQSGKFLCRLFPYDEFDGSKYFHYNILEEMGVQEATSPSINKLIAGGGKIEVEMIEDYVEVRLYGVSTTYGPYQVSDIDRAKLEQAIEARFNLGMMPILVIPDFKG